MLDIAHSNSERLVRLINNILDVEKIEAGKMAFNGAQNNGTPGVDPARGSRSAARQS
jgi:hypothetical protein